MLRFIAQRDHRLMQWVNNWPAPGWIRVWMLSATRAGDGWLWCAVGLAILLFGGRNRFRAPAAMGLAAALGAALFQILKRMIGRTRPCDIAPHCWANLPPPDRFSFPSGHTIEAFAVSTPVVLFFPSLTAGILFCAFSVALSRILLGMHFLSDVVTGAAIGAGLGYGVFLLFARA